MTHSFATVSFFLSLINKQQLIELPVEIQAAGEDACAHVLRVATPGRAAELNLDLPKFQAWAALAYSLARLGASYEPAGTVSTLATIFYAEPLYGTNKPGSTITCRYGIGSPVARTATSRLRANTTPYSSPDT